MDLVQTIMEIVSTQEGRLAASATIGAVAGLFAGVYTLNKASLVNDRIPFVAVGPAIGAASYGLTEAEGVEASADGLMGFGTYYLVSRGTVGIFGK